MTDANETAKTAGRGGLAIAVAKVSFIVFSFAQQLLLPRLLGTAGYGVVSRVLAIVGIVNNVIIATSIQGVSKAVSSVPEAHATQAFRRTLTVHLFVAMAASLGFALLAGTIADEVGAPHATGLLRIVALVVLFYGVYAPLVGSLNGRRRFYDQAGLDIGYGILRTLGLAGGALVAIAVTHVQSNGAMGAVAGFAAAAALIIPVAASRSGIGELGPEGPKLKEYLAFLLPLTIGQVFLNLLLQTDFMLLSRFVGMAAKELALPVEAADELIGVYRGAQLFAFLPYQMLISVQFILFPMLARANSEGDAKSVKEFSMGGVRLALVLTGLMTATISGLAPHVLRFAFPEAIWSRGGEALRVLSLGMGSFAILGIVSAALTSVGRAVHAMALTAMAVVLVAGACALTVPKAAFGPAMLVQSATSTSIALGVSTVVAAFVLARVVGGFVKIASLLRVFGATAVAIAVASRLPWMGKLLVLPEAAAVGVVYVTILIATRELGGEDLRRIKQILGRRA